MTTGRTDWRKLAATRQWIIDRLAIKVDHLEAENRALQARLDTTTANAESSDT